METKTFPMYKGDNIVTADDACKNALFKQGYSLQPVTDEAVETEAEDGVPVTVQPTAPATQNDFRRRRK